MNENLIGYIFPSRDGGFMIDTGPLEYPSSMIESFEIWDGTKFVAAEKKDIRVPQMSGTKVRFKVSQ